MRDISLHVLDLMENSIRAGASIIRLTLEEDHAGDRLRIGIEDDGRGLQVTPEAAVDPFYTTKDGRRIGLGLSLFQSAAERSGGTLQIGTSELGGLAVWASMRLSHIDRSPMGDLAATLSSVVCTNPELDLWCRLRNGDRERSVRASELARRLPSDQRCGLSLARAFCECLREQLAAVALSA